MNRSWARFFGILMISFSPLPLLLMLLSWGSDLFGGSLVPQEITVIGGLYGLLGAVALVFGIVLVGRYYRGHEVEFKAREARLREEALAADVEIKRTAMTAAAPGEDAESQLAAVRKELAALRVQLNLDQIDRQTFDAQAEGLMAREKELKAQVEPDRESQLRRIPDHNRARR